MLNCFFGSIPFIVFAVLFYLQTEFAYNTDSRKWGK